MLFCVAAFVAAAAYAAAYKTDPEIVDGVADAAEGGFATAERGIGWVVGVGGCICGGRESERRVCVSTYWTAASLPFLETVAVEDVLAWDCEQAGCIVHSLEANGTCW